MREVLSYDPETGIFRWLVMLAARGPVGDVAGCIARSKSGKEYWLIRFDNQLYLAHRLAWAYHYNEQPPPEIDHEDGDGLHNWIKNLRKASRGQNSANMRKKIKSSTGFRGVYPYGTNGLSFEAKAMKDGRSIRFGVYDTPERAYVAYCAGMKSLFGDFASVV